MGNYLQTLFMRMRHPFDSESSISCNGDGDNSMHEYPHNEDVLIRIFKLLPSTDHKNVRLTCKLWSKVCSSSSVTAGEKLVFRLHYDDNEIAKLLCNLTFESIHLEFQSQPISKIREVVWKTCGSRIRGLHFYRCRDFDVNSLRIVIEHCEHLCDINLHESECCPLVYALLNYFIKEKKIKREMLSSFSFRYERIYLNADILRKIFTVFPKIQNFVTGDSAANPIQGSDEDVETLAPSELPPQLKSLVVYLHSVCLNREHWLRAPMIPLSRLRLKKFETMLNHETSESVNSLEKTLFEFIEAQEELEIINLRMANSGSQVSPSQEWALFIKKLIFHVLDQCRNLREFRLTDRSKVLLTKEETIHFFARVANLKCLVINECRFRIPSPFALSSASRFAIETLMVESDTEEFEKCFLGQCSLKHLRMEKLSDELLQEILTTQPDLRALVLDDIQDSFVSWSSAFHKLVMRVIRCGSSISAPRRLEYLRFNERAPYRFTQKMANEIRFPLLKHLTICVNSYYILEKLSQIAPNLPALEVLELNKFDLCKWKDIIGVCRHLRNLRRLSVHDVTKPLFDDLLQLFCKCPNLRYVIQIRLNNVYLFNPFTEQMSERSLNDVRFPGIDDIFYG